MYGLGNLDRDRLQWLAEHPHYRDEPWRFKHCVRAGACELCGVWLGKYESKWHHPDGRMVCSHHWIWNSEVLPPTVHWMYYTDG